MAVSSTLVPMSPAHSAWILSACLGAITFQLLRLSIDLIRTASVKESAHFVETHHDVNAKDKEDAADKKDKAGPKSYTPKYTTNSLMQADTNNYGSVASSSDTSQEQELLLPAASTSAPTPTTLTVTPPSPPDSAIWSWRIQAVLALLFLFEAIKGDDRRQVLPEMLVWSAFVVIALGAWLTRMDMARKRFNMLARVLYLGTSFTLFLPIAIRYFDNRSLTTVGDELIFNGVLLFVLLSIVEVVFCNYPETAPVDPALLATTAPPRKKRLSRAAILTLLKPYFWPDETSESATTNRVRAILTWVCVFLSKICNLFAPILLGWAATALAHQDYTSCIQYSITYSIIGFLGSTFKEGQSLIYLKVAQAAFIQLSETTFCHLHTLSLDWHLSKKLGEVIRSMDRGIAACDTLMKYLFLWLVPALFECFVVCIIFATYFHYLPLALAVFYFVWIYIVWTILVTLWRKKFRKQVVQSDNEWHDRCTDSLINFETVKFFTAEDYERVRFGESMQKFQEGTVNVQSSLSLLNISQKFILQICLATALSMSAWGIRKRIDCCLEMGCDSGVSQCCQAIDIDTCPGMQVGDFVAVLTYTLQLFAPLNFLGSVYNAVVMAVIDLTNLSELLAETADVVDAPDAMMMPTENVDDPDIAVEFDNVFFHYPTQPSDKGLKGVSFKMKRGTTTAIVGPTGAGKTTISRLFFRFYDVLDGAIKVNGTDVRMVTQKSLRGAMGVVPQTASMFNDTIRANLLYGRRDATQDEIRQAAEDAQLLEFIESLDLGWETTVGDRGLKLSGGEKQRAAIARCLLKDPPFVCKYRSRSGSMCAPR